jgi:subtilase family serine protease
MLRTRFRWLPTLVLLLFLAGCTTAVTGVTTPGDTGIARTATAAIATPSAVATGDACPTNENLPATCLSPHALQVAYNVDSLISKGFTGKGQTVVDIVSFGSPTLQQDMQVYDQTFDLPAIDLQVISPLNEKPYDPDNDRAGWAEETTLDVQIIHSIAPGAKVVVLESPVAETEGTIGLPEFRQLEQYVIDHKLGNIVSQSWGASELTLTNQQGQAEIQKWNTLLQNGTTQQGITYFSGSGDNGATDYSDLQSKKLGTVRTTSFAPDSPWVTSVGGTAVRLQGSTRQEVAWPLSGGGFSRFYQTPDYQKMLPPSVLAQFGGKRGVPDVSADGDPDTGLAMYIEGQWTLAGGTSASTPVWAGLTAIADQMAGRPLGFINPALYKIAATSNYHQDFYDITSGNNTNTTSNVPGYNATAGWDPITGLGSPNAAHLLPDLIAATK